MGFFDWFKKKPKNEVSEEEIRINELNKRLDQLRDTKFSGVYKEFEGYNSKIKKIFESIERDLNALGRKKINEKEVDARILVRLRSAKENLINRMGFLCKSFREKSGQINTISGVKDFLELIETTLADINKTAKYSEMSAYGFKKEVNAVGIKMKNVIEIYKLAKNSFDESLIPQFEMLEHKSKNLLDLLDYRKTIENEQNEQKQDMEKEKDEVEKLESEKKKVEESEKFKNAKDISKKIEDLEDESKNLKIVLRNKFSEFSKAVQKALHSSGFGDEDEKIVKSYLEEPIHAIDTDKDLKMNSILERIKNDVENERIQFDERLKAKTSETISMFLNNDELENTRNRKNEIEEKIKKLEEELKKSGLYEHNMLGVKIEKSKKKIKDLETAIEVQNDLLTKNKAGVEKLKDEVVNLLAKFDLKAKLV